jgi:hypothetical protein
MSGIRARARKTQYWLKHDLLVFDNVVLIIAFIFCLIWTWGSISSMSRNWNLAQELMNRRREKALLELEVETLELENEYYLSAEYQELAARKYQGKMLAGETMVYLPANSDRAKHKHDTDATSTTVVNTEEMSNFAQWMAFLFGIKL